MIQPGAPEIRGISRSSFVHALEKIREGNVEFILVRCIKKLSHTIGNLGFQRLQAQLAGLLDVRLHQVEEVTTYDRLGEDAHKTFRERILKVQGNSSRIEQSLAFLLN